MIHEIIAVLAVCLRACLILPLAAGLAILNGLDEARARRNAKRAGEGWEE
jgi:hypothetical protein